jgi:hypothetical protein
MMKNIAIHAVTASEQEQLLKWLAEPRPFVLELPHGFTNEATETATASLNGRLLCGLTGTLGIVLDPLIKDPQANPLELTTAIVMLARALEFWGSAHGVAESYIAVPDALPGFAKIVEACGYEPTAQSCRIFRRLLKEYNREGEKPAEVEP